MDYMETMKARHAVRSFTDRKIEGKTLTDLQSIIEKINAASGLDMKLVLDEPEAFGGRSSRGFKNCRNYIVIGGKNGSNEKTGYYGEKAVLAAQALGLNSCWVEMSYSKGKVPVKLEPGYKIQAVIALGYGENQGVPHKSKTMEALSKVDGEAPDWFKKGMEAAMLAPTAMNQQKFSFALNGDKVSAKPGIGFYSKVDLGIAKAHFELGAGKDNFKWA